MEDFVTFEIAKKLKEKDFNEPCWNAINSFGCTYRNGWLEYLSEQEGEFIVQNDLKQGDYLLPTISQVLKWLREEKDLHIVIPACFNKNYWWEIRDFNRNISEYSDAEYISYEEAALSGIEYALVDLI